ncbi:hypothetical protein DPMN_143994 [Dreissena polymorpha]|uniref:Uncharacterized protein n=1 Tax=Dreissena polymorpha TaxID=45954 RepID=A0A9D4GHA0_DREPO|nr:hypothetical protein DPMN_143994 [Dreissena polymorpha]
MYIERAHRVGKGPRTNESKRPMVIRFKDYVDTEIIMEETYKLKGTPYGIDRQYPREIARARSELHNIHEARDARSRRLKMQIGYPARLLC